MRGTHSEYRLRNVPNNSSNENMFIVYSIVVLITNSTRRFVKSAVPNCSKTNMIQQLIVYVGYGTF